MPTVRKITLNFVFFSWYFTDVFLGYITKQKKKVQILREPTNSTHGELHTLII